MVASLLYGPPVIGDDVKESADFTILQLVLRRRGASAGPVAERDPRLQGHEARVRDVHRRLSRLGLGVEQVPFAGEDKRFGLDRLECLVIINNEAGRSDQVVLVVRTSMIDPVARVDALPEI